MRLLLLLPMVVILFNGCNIINPDESVPAYIYIDSFQFQAGPGQGTSSEKITELWVYAEDKMIGVFDLPAQIPILNTGITDLRIFAGIKNNGISTTRIRYPYYQPFDTTLTIKSGMSFRFEPRFHYFDGVLIDQKGFESGNFLVPVSPNQGTFNVVTDDALIFEGDRSGIGKLEPGQNLLYFKDDENRELPSGNSYFVEMNYSCNAQFALGLLSTTGIATKKNLAVIMNPTRSGTGEPVWNKIYIDLGLIPQQNATAEYFELYFQALPTANEQTIEIYLDNIKFVQWE